MTKCRIYFRNAYKIIAFLCQWREIVRIPGAFLRQWREIVHIFVETRHALSLRCTQNHDKMSDILEKWVQDWPLAFTMPRNCPHSCRVTTSKPENVHLLLALTLKSPEIIHILVELLCQRRMTLISSASGLWVPINNLDKGRWRWFHLNKEQIPLYSTEGRKFTDV
jgi:hypothetical protein